MKCRFTLYIKILPEMRSARTGTGSGDYKIVVQLISASGTLIDTDNILPTTLLTIGDPKFTDPKVSTLTAKDKPYGSGVAGVVGV